MKPEDWDAVLAAKDARIATLEAERDGWRTVAEELDAQFDRLRVHTQAAESALAEARKAIREYMECDRLMRMDGCPDERYQPALLAMERLAAIDSAIEAEKQNANPA